MLGTSKCYLTTSTVSILEPPGQTSETRVTRVSGRALILVTALGTASANASNVLWNHLWITFRNLNVTVFPRQHLKANMPAMGGPDGMSWEGYTNLERALDQGKVIQKL